MLSISRQWQRATPKPVSSCRAVLARTDVGLRAAAPAALIAQAAQHQRAIATPPQGVPTLRAHGSNGQRTRAAPAPAARPSNAPAGRKGAAQPAAAPPSQRTTTSSSSDVMRNTKYQRTAQQLNDMVNALRTTGAQFILDLPTVCVCGNQSAGKSSVMEGLTGIRLPRNTGTCTRSPMEVRMRSQGTFTCQVSLRHEYDSAGAKRKDGVKEPKFGKVVTDEAEVELLIRRAQKALLNPGKNQASFVKYDFSEPGDDADNELQFTKNVVVVEITGGPADLTLIDLPGIIRSTERQEDAHYIALIQELLRSYMKNDNTIIVATVTCSDDIDNQEVVKLAKEADPEMRRTLGVLTKPDRIASGEHDQWLAILNGHRYPLNLGWYAVRNPDQNELTRGITFDQAREAEHRFFQKARAWQEAGAAERLGTEHLRDSLSELLCELIKLKLPGMRESVRDRLTTVNAELEALPTAVFDPAAEYAMLVNELHAAILGMAVGDPSSSAVAKQEYRKFRGWFVAFQRAIAQTQPTFKVEYIDEEDEEDNSTVFVCCNADGSNLLTAETEKKLQELQVAGHAAATKSQRFKTRSKKALSVEDVNRAMEETRGSALPGCLPYSSIVDFVGRAQEDWEEITIECCNAVMVEMHDVAMEQVEARLKRFPELLLKVKGVLEDVHEDLMIDVHVSVMGLLEDELQQPFTLNEHYLLDSTNQLMLRLLQVWEEHRAEEPEAAESSALQPVASGAWGTGDPSPSSRASARYKPPGVGADQQALELMATVMAYLKVASKRYGDVVPMRISNAFLRRLPQQLRGKLLEQLSDTEQLRELMQEDGAVVARRKQLLGDRDLLKENSRQLNLF